MLQEQHRAKRGLTAPLDSPFQGVSPPEIPDQRQASGLAPARRAALAPCPTVRRLDTAKACRSGRADGKAGRESQPCDRSGAGVGRSTAAPLLVLIRGQTSLFGG